MMYKVMLWAFDDDLPEHNEDSSSLRPKGIPNGHFYVVKHDIRCSSRRGIARLDRRRLDTFSAFNKDDSEAFFSFAPNGEVVSKAIEIRSEARQLA